MFTSVSLLIHIIAPGVSRTAPWSSWTSLRSTTCNLDCLLWMLKYFSNTLIFRNANFNQFRDCSSNSGNSIAGAEKQSIFSFDETTNQSLNNLIGSIVLPADWVRGDQMHWEVHHLSERWSASELENRENCLLDWLHDFKIKASWQHGTCSHVLDWRWSYMSCVSDGKVSGVQKVQTKWQTKWNKPLKRTPENIILQVNTSPQNTWHRIQSVHIEMN